MFLKPSSSIVTGDAAETPGKFEPTLNSGYSFKDNFERPF